MRRIPNRVVAAAVVTMTALVLLATTGHGGPAYDDTGTRPSTTHRCQEDEPCWNPATMGNHRGYVCQVEPSAVSTEGYDIVAYTDTDGLNPAGFLVPCPPDMHITGGRP